MSTSFARLRSLPEIIFRPGTANCFSGCTPSCELTGAGILQDELGHLGMLPAVVLDALAQVFQADTTRREIDFLDVLRLAAQLLE